MAPKVTVCCVPGCLNRSDRRYHIPRVASVQRVWIRRIGDSHIHTLKSPWDKLVCGTHFNKKCFGSSGKLKKFALPTLNLPEYVRHPNEEDIFYRVPKKPVQYTSTDKYKELVERIINIASDKRGSVSSILFDKNFSSTSVEKRREFGIPISGKENAKEGIEEIDNCDIIIDDFNCEQEWRDIPILEDT